MYRNIRKTIRALKCLSFGGTRLRLGVGLGLGACRLGLLGFVARGAFLLLVFRLVGRRLFPGIEVL